MASPVKTHFTVIFRKRLIATTERCVITTAPSQDKVTTHHANMAKNPSVPPPKYTRDTLPKNLKKCTYLKEFQKMIKGVRGKWGNEVEFFVV
jgi:hypothetical protein